MESYDVDGAVAEIIPNLIEAVGTVASQDIALSPQLYKDQVVGRLRIEKSLVEWRRKAARRGPEKWVIMDGDYREYDWDTDSYGPLDGPMSGERERQLDRTIEKMLALNEGKRPTLILEFGAGYALSLMRMGSKYAKHVQAGALSLIATNLDFLPTEEADAKGYTGIARRIREPLRDGSIPKWTAEELEWIRRNQHLVQYKRASVLELPGLSARLGSDAVSPVLGNATVIVEANAVKHSAVPDVALATFATLLAPGGELHLGTKESNLMYPPPERLDFENGQIVELPLGYIEYCRPSLGIGRLAIEQPPFSMMLVEDEEDSRVATYRKGDV